MAFCNIYKLDPHSQSDGISLQHKVQNYVLYLYEAEYKWSTIQTKLSGVKDCLVRMRFITHKTEFYSAATARLIQGIKKKQTEEEPLLDATKKVEFTMALLIDLQTLMEELLDEEDFTCCFAMVCFQCLLSLRCKSGMVTDDAGLSSWSARPENIILTFGYGRNITAKSVWELKPGDQPSGIEVRLLEKNSQSGDAIRTAGRNNGDGLNLLQYITDAFIMYPPERKGLPFGQFPKNKVANGHYYLKLIEHSLKVMAANLGIPSNLFGTHIFRNWSAFQLAAAGCSREVIMRQTGHKAPSSLDPYLTSSVVSHGHLYADALHGTYSSTAHTVAAFKSRLRVPVKSRFSTINGPSITTCDTATNAQRRHSLAAVGKLKRKMTQPVMPARTPITTNTKKRTQRSTTANTNNEDIYMRQYKRVKKN